MLLIRLIALVGALALAGCSSTQTASQYTSQPVLTAQPAETAQVPSSNPALATAEAKSMTDVSAFIDPQAAAQLTAASRDQAAGAQYNALQFGRPGAPRNWQGSGGQSGVVVVGPPVNVNALYCRTFTHEVTVGGQKYSKKGMACREASGRWSVDPTAG